MAWTGSKVFRPFQADTLDNTSALDLGSDGFKAALFNNSITPDQNVTSANSAYNAAQWATANEVYQAGQWPQGGVALASPVLNSGTVDVVFFDSADTSSGAGFTGPNIYGALIYDITVATPVANQGVCFNYYGGPNGVTNGTFTSVWNAQGIARWTMT
jgi:hypothetical protein